MKTFLLLSILLVGSFTTLQAQNNAPYTKAVYAEFGGPGIGISANYDMRFKRGQQNGLGFRVGIGGLNIEHPDYSESLNLLTMPIELNVVTSRRRSGFEAGAGIILANIDVSDANNQFTGRGATGFVNMGYRYQPLRNGLLFKLNWTPLVNSSGFHSSWFGFSLGFGFK